jgi:amino-acid N-acetyltransferase
MNKEEMTTISIEPANQNDLPAILDLLATCQLPQEGLSEHLATTLVARNDKTIVGNVALEVYGSAALLRSVAVAPTFRGRGLGQQLTQAALALAGQLKINCIYLLTETAGDFFPKFGFHPIDRSGVAPAVRGSLEFTSL